MTPLSVLLTQMSAAELSFWEYIYQEELLGEQRSDYRSARVEAAIKNFAGKTLKEDIVIDPFECMPFSKIKEKPPEQRTQEENVAQMKNTLAAMAGLQKAKLNRSGKGNITTAEKK